MEIGEEKPLNKHPRWRLRRWSLRLISIAVITALVSAVMVSYFYRYGNDVVLAGYVMKLANPALRGRLEFGKLHWNPGALWNVVKGVPIPAEVENFAVYDSKGTRVIFARHATAKMDLFAFLFGGGHLLISDVKAREVQCLVARLAGSSPDKLQLGLFDAFTPRHSSEGGGPSPRIEFRNFSVEKATVKFDFPLWSLTLNQLESKGSFIFGGGILDQQGMEILQQTKAAGGHFRLAGFHFPFADFKAHYLGGSKPTDLPIHIAALIDGAPITIDGAFVSLYGQQAGIQLEIAARQAQRMLKHLLAGPWAAGLRLGGAGELRGTLQGALTTPIITAKVSGLALQQGALTADQLQGRLVVDFLQQKLHLFNGKLRFWDGWITAMGRLDFETLDWKGQLALQQLDPAAANPLLSGKLSGTVELEGGLLPGLGGKARIQMALTRARRDYLPGLIRLGGSVNFDPERVSLDHVSLDGDGLTLGARGAFAPRSKKLDLWLKVAMPGFDQWLRRHDLPVIARSIASDGELHLHGQLPRLHLQSGRLFATDVGFGTVRLKRVSAAVALTAGTLKITQVRSQGFGGKLEGEATLELFAQSLARPLKVPFLQSQIRLIDWDLAAMGSSADLAGKLAAQVQIKGPIDKLQGSAILRIPRARLFGDTYHDTELRLGLLRDRVSVYDGQLARSAGGQLALWGDLFFDGQLDLRLAVAGFPVAGIPKLPQGQLGLGGTLRGELKLIGTFKRPQLAGTIELAGVQVRGVTLGSGAISFKPGADAMQVKGHLWQRRISLEGTLLLQPKPRLNLTLNLKRLPIDPFLEQLRRIGDMRGELSGRIRLALDAEEGLTWADVDLSSVRLSLRYRQPGRRMERVVSLNNQQPLLARYDGSQLHLVKTKLLTMVAGKARQRAEFTIGGWLAPTRADLRLHGTIALEILEFFLAKRVKKITGDATADLHLTGPLQDLSLKGDLEVNRVRLWLPKFDREIEVPRGRIQLVPGELHLTTLLVRMGGAQFKSAGIVKLEQFRPTTAELSLVGDLNLKLLELLVPQQVSSASGMATVRLQLSGPVRDPQFSGELEINRIEVVPRGWGRTLTLNKGRVAFSNYVVKAVIPLEGTYDEGLIKVVGEIRLDRWDLVDIYLKITGTGIPQRQPRVYNAEVNLSLLLLGDSHQLSLEGQVELVDVRYIQKFDIIRQAFIKPRIYEEDVPFWRGSSLLENLRLQLAVRSTGQMAVKNNYAQLSLSGAFVVVGTLAEPRLGGQIRVEEGTFRIPFLRGDFTISRGEIAFNKQDTVEQAELNITGETLFMDRNGVDYQVKLNLEGPLNQIGITLSSTPNLEQGQIWALLATGRTTEQLRAQLAGSPESGQGGQGQVYGAADAQVKQLTGEILSQIMVDPLRKVTRLDLFRLEVGTESVQISAKKKLGRFLNLAGEYELGLLGDSRSEGRLEFKMHDLLMLVGKLERVSTRLETEDEDPTRGRIQLKVSLPLR